MKSFARLSKVGEWLRGARMPAATPATGIDSLRARATERRALLAETITDTDSPVVCRDSRIEAFALSGVRRSESDIAAIAYTVLADSLVSATDNPILVPFTRPRQVSRGVQFAPPSPSPLLGTRRPRSSPANTKRNVEFASAKKRRCLPVHEANVRLSRRRVSGRAARFVVEGFYLRQEGLTT